MHRTLMAQDGMVYTNGEAYGKTIHIGEGDSVENWHEIPIAEYQQILCDTNNDHEVM